MTAAALLTRLRDLGVTVEARGDGIAVRPASVVPADLMAALRTRKQELLAALAAPMVEPVAPTTPEQIEALALDLAACPAVTIIDPERGWAYLRAEATRQLRHAARRGVIA